MFFEVLAWLIVGLLAPVLGYFTLEVLFGLKRTSATVRSEQLSRTVLLIPAHNEALAIGATVDSLRHALGPNSAGLIEVLVVADNCTDHTAETAAAYGATVTQRNDVEKRGKGYALAHGRDFLAARPIAQRPHAVIVLDADCRTDRNSILELSSLVTASQRPYQASNLLLSRAEAAPMVQISNFAMVVKNLVRARGLQRIGGGIPLFGTGMAFPWAIFAEAPLATGDAVEDMRLALELAEKGYRVRLAENARVVSEPAAVEDMTAQRSRWEHGFMRTALSRAIPLLAHGIARRSRHKTALGAHLLVPPLALLFLISGAALAITVAVGLIAGVWGPALVLGAFIANAVAGVIVAWLREGRDTLSAQAILRTPLYVLWKLPLYLGFFRSQQTEWNRTRRSGEDRPPSS